MLNLVELASLGFASYRVTQFVVWDSLLDGWRTRIEMWHAKKFNSGPRTFFRDLLGCVYCVGFHSSWLTLLTYLLTTGGLDVSPSGFWLFGIQSFAVAGVQALLNRWDDSRPGHHPKDA